MTRRLLRAVFKTRSSRGPDPVMIAILAFWCTALGRAARRAFP